MNKTLKQSFDRTIQILSGGLMSSSNTSHAINQKREGIKLALLLSHLKNILEAMIKKQPLSKFYPYPQQLRELVQVGKQICHYEKQKSICKKQQQKADDNSKKKILINPKNRGLSPIKSGENGQSTKTLYVQDDEKKVVVLTNSQIVKLLQMENHLRNDLISQKNDYNKTKNIQITNQLIKSPEFIGACIDSFFQQLQNLKKLNLEISSYLSQKNYKTFSSSIVKQMCFIFQLFKTNTLQKVQKGTQTEHKIDLIENDELFEINNKMTQFQKQINTLFKQNSQFRDIQKQKYCQMHSNPQICHITPERKYSKLTAATKESCSFRSEESFYNQYNSQAINTQNILKKKQIVTELEQNILYLKNIQKISELKIKILNSKQCINCMNVNLNELQEQKK